MSADRQRADCKFTTFELVPGNDPEQNICLLMADMLLGGTTDDKCCEEIIAGRADYNW